MRIGIPIRLLCGFSIGAILTTLLAWIIYPTGGPAMIFSWPLASGIGWLTNCLASRFKILVSGLSATAGAAFFMIVNASVQLHLYLLLYGGPYVVFALLGSLAASVFRKDWEDSFYGST